MATASRLDIKYSTFLKISDKPEEKAEPVTINYTEEQLQYLDVGRLVDRINRISGKKFTQAELDYLWATGKFNKEFIQLLGKRSLPMLVNDNNSIAVAGDLLEVEILKDIVASESASMYHQEYSDSFGLPTENLVTEGIRRLQAKLDLLRLANVKILENGFLNRVSREWHNFIVPAIIGDANKQLVGTTSTIMAMEFGLTPVDDRNCVTADVTWYTNEALKGESEVLMDGPLLDVIHASNHNPGVSFVYNFTNAASDVGTPFFDLQMS